MVRLPQLRGHFTSVPLGTAAVALGGGYLAWRGAQALGAPAGLERVRHAVLSEGALLVSPVVLGVVAVTMLVERRWPAVPRPFGARGHQQDMAYLVLYALVAVPAVTLLGTGFAVTVLGLIPGLVLTRSAFAPLPSWVAVAAVVILMDACNWFAHLLNHRVGAFWRYHAVHHSQEEMSILTTFRAHPLVHASFEVAALPLVLLGTSGVVPSSVLVVYVVLSTLPHANVRWSYGPLRFVLVSPAYHRFHHDRDDRRGVNLGTVFVWWDVLAGLAVLPGSAGRVAPVATGLSDRAFTIEQAPDAGGVLRSLCGQLVDPWRRLDPHREPAHAGAPLTVHVREVDREVTP